MTKNKISFLYRKLNPTLITATKSLIFSLFCFLLSGCISKIPLKGGVAAVEWEYFFIKEATSKSNGSDSSGVRTVVDGDITTKWQSAEDDDESWVALQLRASQRISSIKILWGTVAAEVYAIQVSKDGKTWQTVVEIEDGTSEEVRTVEFPALSAKHVKISCIKKTRQTGGYAIKEIELNPVAGAGAGAVKITSSSSMAGNMPELAADGDMTTRWESEHGIDPSWLCIDLGKSRKIKKVKIKWEKAAAAEYTIDVSDDEQDWKTVRSVNNGKEEETKTLTFSPVLTKYVRINGMKRLTEWGYSIWEIEVYE